MPETEQDYTFDECCMGNMVPPGFFDDEDGDTGGDTGHSHAPVKDKSHPSSCPSCGAPLTSFPGGLKCSSPPCEWAREAATVKKDTQHKPGHKDDSITAPMGTGEPSMSRSTPILEVPDIRQPDHFSCGACGAMTTGRFLGVGPDTLAEWKKALGTDVQQSTRPQAIVDYLTSLGLDVIAKQNMTIDDLAESIDDGRPIICPVQEYGPAESKDVAFDYGHYLVVIGVVQEQDPDKGYVLCQDSSSENALAGEDSLEAPGRVMISLPDWLKAWHDRDIDGNKYIRYGISVGKRAG